MSDLMLLPCRLVLPLEDGSVLEYGLPTPAEQDAPLLQLWLYGKSKKTVMAYLQDMRKFYATIGLSLQETRLGDLQTFSTSLLHLKPASRKRTLNALKSVLSFGAKLNMLPTNVGAVLKTPKLEDTLAERIMSEQSVEDIIRLEPNTRNHAMLTLFYYGGLRAFEICNLKWRNLQERDAAGQITVFGKGQKTRPVLLDGDTWLEVWRLRSNAGLEDYVFPSRQSKSRKGKQDNRLSESRVWQIVKEAARRAGVAIDKDFKSKVSPHWFRHAHATHALEAGAPITLVKETLGHGSILTTGLYAHARPNDSSALMLRRKREVGRGVDERAIN